MPGPQKNRAKRSDNALRSCKIYSYATKDIGDWIERKSYQHEITLASFVYAALKYVNKTKPNFQPKEYLPE